MENPSYYAIIPSNVRYDERLTANAKLLYAEITSLCNKDGVCTASNKYFGNLYKVTSVSVSKWISELVEFGYLRTEMIYKENSKEIIERRIYIVGTFTINLNKDSVETKENKNEDAIDYKSLLEFFNRVTKKNIRVINDKAKRQFNARIKEGYTKTDIAKAIVNCYNDEYHKSNPKYLTPEFISRADKFEKYLNIECSRMTEEDIAIKRRIELKKSMGI